MAPLTVSAARERLTSTVRHHQRQVGRKQPLVFGTHRRAEAVILQFETYQHLLEGQDSGSLMEHVLARRQLIRRIAKLNNTAEAAVFGSAVRGDETLESDIDLLIEPMGGATHFDLAQFQIDMEQLFQRPIDGLSRGALDPSKDGKILDEAVPV